ncbi:MAG: aminoacyl-tRNA hydrolase [Candidatus Omnitrophica bacterium]|nr:aminoacyl-tRNA hydrolase [Candidatus Omnitrophota bacterium]
MKAIFGLGNPGKRYGGTRHNIGFVILDELARRYDVKFDKHVFLSDLCEVDVDGEKVLLLKPQTYMNQSGQAAVELTSFYKQEINVKCGILIVLDDFALPFGKLRFREKGTTGGHQGLTSILESLGSPAVPRLRVGIGSLEGGNDSHWTDFVLEKFGAGEIRQLPTVICKSADACEHWVRYGSVSTMQKFNVEDAG